MNTLLLEEEKKISLVDIAIPLPINDPFTYRLPETMTEKVKVGMRVKVPFRNRTITGYVVGLDVQKEVKRPKDISEVLDENPVLDDHLLRLGKWISDYYVSSWGEALQSMLPRLFKIPAAGPREIPPVPEFLKDSGNLSLNAEQVTAFETIEGALQGRRFKEIFLFGVTGGGKSELYIRAIREVLLQGKSAICLVPEIALTEQLRRFFIQHFHEELEILHSRLTDRERWLAWLRIKSGQKRVVLGARSSVFAPAPHLGLIIMDEEQEGSYKQDQTPRYHAREVARWRARDLGAVFLTGTATPTLETMHRAQSGEIEFVKLTKRYDGREMPEVTVVDLKEAQNISKGPAIISLPLKRAIEETLKAKNGILLLLNRRGFSTHVRCLACSHVVSCPHCEVALTLHQEQQKLICHYCNYQLEVPEACVKCKHSLFKFTGIGTEKVESEVARLFPQAHVGRLDADIAKKRGAHEEILKKFRERKIDILIGTQMIAKGFDFPHVTLAGIVNADTGLLLPDFRSAERTFQLLTQMAGRSGRGKELGRVIVQTYSPDHYSIRAASKHEYARFFNEEIERRKTYLYPPFAQLINVIIRAKIEKDVYQSAFELAKTLKSTFEPGDMEVLGPAPLPIYRLRGHYRWHIMLKSARFEPVKQQIEQVLSQARLKKGTFLAVDVDPMVIL